LIVFEHSFGHFPAVNGVGVWAWALFLLLDFTTGTAVLQRIVLKFTSAAASFYRCRFRGCSEFLLQVLPRLAVRGCSSYFIVVPKLISIKILHNQWGRRVIPSIVQEINRTNKPKIIAV
jgi:hypothetical protein